MTNNILRSVVSQWHKRSTVNATGCGFDCHLRKWNIKSFHYLALVTRQCEALISESHYAMPPEFRGKAEKVSYHQVPSAYPTKCGLQREIQKIYTVYTKFFLRKIKKQNILYYSDLRSSIPTTIATASTAININFNVI